MIATICHKCNLPINEKYFSRINNHSWHDHCIRCNKCGCQLATKCYELDNELLCPDDYVRKKFKKCFHCKGPIYPTQKVLYTNSLAVFHQNCFRCTYCERTLIPGDRYYSYSTGSMIICLDDYENLKQDIVPAEKNNTECLMDVISSDYESKELRKGEIFKKFTTMISNLKPNLSPDQLEDDLISDLDPSLDETYSSDNDKSCEIRRRTPRTTIKASQLDSLKATFTITPKPSRQMREKLAECTGLSMRVIQVWFQNRRSKERRSKLNSQRKLEKYRFSLQNEIPRDDNISNSSTNSRLFQRNTDLPDMHIHLNSIPINFDPASNVPAESNSDIRYSSHWFINRSADN